MQQGSGAVPQNDSKMSRMTAYRELHDITVKMTSYEKVSNTEVLRILTTYKIGFGVVFIRGRMQLVETK